MAWNEGMDLIERLHRTTTCCIVHHYLPFALLTEVLVAGEQRTIVTAIRDKQRHSTGTADHVQWSGEHEHTNVRTSGLVH
jgi:hypothetical protein